MDRCEYESPVRYKGQYRVVNGQSEPIYGPCRLKAVISENGRNYCHMHAPSLRKQRKRKPTIAKIRAKVTAWRDEAQRHIEDLQGRSNTGAYDRQIDSYASQQAAYGHVLALLDGKAD